MGNRKMDGWIWTFSLAFLVFLASWINPGILGNVLPARDAGLLAVAFMIFIGLRVLYRVAKPGKEEADRYQK